jgi:sialate O-acetylesterase
MVKSWREEWDEGDFPFYYCQIAPYDYRRITRAGQDTVNSAFLREQQLKAETMIPNSGMAVMMDIGLEKGIHPMKKQVSGERLARLALVKTYGMQGVTAESPRYSGMEIHQDTVVCNFDKAPMWINSKGTFESNAFELAGEDRVFHPAKAQIVRQRIIVKSNYVPHPVAVRYAFKDWTIGDIFGDDLPVSSFRSDKEIIDCFVVFRRSVGMRSERDISGRTVRNKRLRTLGVELQPRMAIPFRGCSGCRKGGFR